MRVMAVILAFAAGSALANDGFGGLTATGLTFGRTEAVAMLSEDLRISPERIAVDYSFRNLTARDVTGEVIFPLPPIPVADVLMGMWNLPGDRSRRDLVGFTATVDGMPVAVAADWRAVIADPLADRQAAYDRPGRDVTEVLARHGIPLTLDAEAALAALLAQPEAGRTALAAAGVAEFLPASGNAPAEAWPLWAVAIRYHWTQTFPAGATVAVSHAYGNFPAGGLFYWSDPPEDWLLQAYADYCIDAGTSRAIARALPAADGTGGQVFGQAWNIAYVLRTANSWAGPVGRFRLTIDKGGEGRVVSLCAEGLERTGPATFVMEKRNFSPEGDLDILVVAPLAD